MHTHTLSPAAQQWLDNGELRELNGQQIFVIDTAQNDLPAMLLIHGFPTSSYDFKAIWSTLAQHYRLISLDMLGFGFSAKPRQHHYTIHAQADLFTSLIEQLDIPSYHVLAHDYGVSVAQELLARQIDLEKQATQWRSCTLLNGGLFPETHRALLIQKLLLSKLGRVINAFTGFKQFSKSFAQVFGEHSKPTTNELTDFWQIINYNNGKHVFYNLISYMNDRKQHRARWVDALLHAPVPIGIINGSQDPVSGKHLVTRYQQLGCRLDYLKELPAIGHYPQVESPEEVAHGVLEFISSLN